MAKVKRVTASDILANFTDNVPDSRAVVRRLNVIEQRKREDEDAKTAMIDSLRKLSNKGAETERKFNIAKTGGFEGNLWQFISNPEIAQRYVEKGIDKTIAGTAKIEDSMLEKALKSTIPNLSKKWDFGGSSQIGQGINELLNPKIAQPDTSINALGTLNPVFQIEEGGL